MNRSIIALLLASCATPGAGTHEMSGAGHQTAASSAAQTGATKEAAEHQAAAARLQKNEAQACGSLSDVERHKNPLETLSIVETSPVNFVTADRLETQLAGAQIVVRGDSGLTVGKLQQLLTCHIAHQEVSGPEADMKDCPLAVPDVYVTVSPSGPGYAIQVLARQPGSDRAAEVWRRVQQLPKKA
jgi:hypothetical protein